MSIAGTGLIPWGTDAEPEMLTKRPCWDDTCESKRRVELGRRTPGRGSPGGRTDSEPQLHLVMAGA